MHELTELIRSDMKAALGVTEPGAIAFAVSTAKKYVSGPVRKVQMKLNSGMYKNAFTCGIPGSNHVGNLYAAALGVVAGNPERGLESLAEVTEADNREAEQLVLEGLIEVQMTEITSRIFIQATVKTDAEEAIVTIRDSHTNIVDIVVNGECVFSKESQEEGGQSEIPLIHTFTLKQLVDYVNQVDEDELAFIDEAYEMNYQLFEEGLRNPKTTYARRLLEKNGGEIFSADEQKTASLLCNAAIEARVIGLNLPAMSITGSGAHGIIATLPLLAVCRVNGQKQAMLRRATALSYLVCMYIKEYSGKLSAFCGCGIAAGTGMACGVLYLKKDLIAIENLLPAMERTINNMASSITGMICDGGNKGCTMKGIVAVDAAFQSVDFAMHGISIDAVHGINGMTPEDTMRNMGLIASPGMVQTEAEIVKIMETK